MRKRAVGRYVALCMLLVASFIAGPDSSSAATRRTIDFSEAPGPTFDLPSGTLARSLAVAPDGTVWLGGERFRKLPGEGFIARLTPRGRLTTFPLGPDRSLLFSGHDLAVGPERDVFFGERHTRRLGEESAIGRLSPTGRLAQFNLGRGLSVGSMTAGPDGNLWFTLSTPALAGVSWVGRITPAGRVSRFRVPGNALQVIAGPDDALWFADSAPGHSALGRMSVDGEPQLFPLPGFSPRSLALGWDGDLWIAGSPGSGNGNVLARVTTAGQVATIPLPGSEGADSIARGPDGDMWVTVPGAPPSPAATKIASVSADGLVGALECVERCKGEPLALATSPDGSLVYAAGLITGNAPSGSGGLTELEDARSHGGTVGRIPSTAATGTKEAE